MFSVIFAIKIWTASKNPIDYLNKKYGPNLVQVVRKYKNTLLKSTKCELDRIFLENCKVNDVTPKFLRFKLYRKSLSSSSFYKSWQKKLLVYEIKSKEKNIFQLSSQVKDHESAIKSCVSIFDWFLIEKYVACENRNFRDSTEKTHDKKLLTLGINRRISPVDPNDVIFNFSSIVIPPRIRYLLAYGPDFGLPTFKLDLIE